MTIDPILAALRAEPAAVASADLLAMPIEEARAAQIARWAPWNAAPPPVALLEDCAIARGHGSPLRCLRIVPNQVAGGRIVFLHGGGWTFGSIETHRDMAIRLAIAAQAETLSIEYRLAPEHPFPAPLDDVLAAIASVSGDGPFALAGDSAGASLALSAMLRLRDIGEKLPNGAALFYGCFTPDFKRPSFAEFGDGAYGLSLARMRQFWENYLGHEPDAAEDIATPGWADLTGLPPILLHAAGLDVLRDDSTALAARLAEAGVDATFEIAPGAVHGYLQMAVRLPIARAALIAAGTFLRARLDA